MCSHFQDALDNKAKQGAMWKKSFAVWRKGAISSAECMMSIQDMHLFSTNIDTIMPCAQHQVGCPQQTAYKCGAGVWAARYNTWLLIKLTPKGVVFSFFLFFSFLFFLFFSFRFCGAGIPWKLAQAPVRIMGHYAQLVFTAT